MTLRLLGISLDMLNTRRTPRVKVGTLQELRFPTFNVCCLFFLALIEKG